MKPPQWVVPLDAKDPEGARIVVKVTDDLAVMLDHYRDAGDPSLDDNFPLPSLVAVHLGAAIQSAAVWAGQEKARREASKR